MSETTTTNPPVAEHAVTAMTPDEFQATVKAFCDPLAHFAPRTVMHLTCLRLLKTVDALAARDDVENDCTDAAHPAWWRGHDYGADAIVRMLALALHEDPTGTLANAPAQALRDAIVAMRKERDELRRRVEAFETFLPKSADGVPLCLGMTVYEPFGTEDRIRDLQVHAVNGYHMHDGVAWKAASRFYSTRAAAEAAAKEVQK